MTKNHKNPPMTKYNVNLSAFFCIHQTLMQKKSNKYISKLIKTKNYLISLITNQYHKKKTIKLKNQKNLTRGFDCSLF